MTIDDKVAELGIEAIRNSDERISPIENKAILPGRGREPGCRSTPETHHGHGGRDSPKRPPIGLFERSG